MCAHFIKVIYVSISFNMKYSYIWLQSHIAEPLPTPEQLKETIIFHAFEVEDIERVGDDTIFDIKILPDRAGDCLSHVGMAREIAGLLNLTLKSVVRTLPSMDLLMPVEVKSDLCRRYMAVRMDGVKVLPSPEWLKNALESVGQRSINNIVDATNFILLDTGQPTHAYDASKIDGGIVVRDAHEGEKIITLSGEEKILTANNLVIADYVGALGIAGVKGGKSAQVQAGSEIVVTSAEDNLRVLGSQSESAQPDHSDIPSALESTTSIILEIANFDPSSVRKTARSLGLQTDAAKRFENNLSPQIVYQAAVQLMTLIKDIAGGEVTGVSDTYPAQVAPHTVSFTIDDIGRLLGDWVTGKIIEGVFDQYHYQYRFTDGIFTFTVPYWRADITGAHDIAEEVGRVIGYESIEPKTLPTVFALAHSATYEAIRAIKAWLVHDGYQEVMTYTFRAKGEVEVAHGAKSKSMLRTNLSDGVKESYDLNSINAAILGRTEVKLFEIGTIFTKESEMVHLCIADKKGIREMTVEEYIAEQKIVVEHTSLETARLTAGFKEWSVYPFSTRDVAVWINTDEDKDVLEQVVQVFASQYCVRPPVLFDEFTKEGAISRAYRFVFQSYEKTLTEADIDTPMKELIARIEGRGVFTIR